MTSDCYAILGVTPTAEDVVIGAAYRALMRHYHPDTNSDPKAQARAQEISAAYAILRDPAKRAEYDSNRGAGGILWPVEDQPEPPPPWSRRRTSDENGRFAEYVPSIWRSTVRNTLLPFPPAPYSTNSTCSRLEPVSV